MTGPRGSMLAMVIEQLTAAFGEPVCRGDCCWWTLSREGRKPVRLSVFLDSDSSKPQGWLCDLDNPAMETLNFSVTEGMQIEPLVMRVRRLLVQDDHISISESPNYRHADASAREGSGAKAT
jgi:hypothetical protein